MDIAKKENAELEGIVHAEGTGGRVVVFRIKPGFDIIKGIKQVCKHYGLKAGIITSIFGSLEKVKLMVPVKDIRFPVPKDHDIRTIVKENVNLAAGCGFINTLEDGDIDIHLHMMLFDGGLGGPASEFPAIGGHLDCRPDSTAPCLGTVEISIEEIKGLKLVRKVCEAVGLPVTFPIKE